MTAVGQLATLRRRFPRHPIRSVRLRVRKRLRDGPDPPERQWVRTVMHADIVGHLRSLDAPTLDAVECSSTTYGSLPWKRYDVLRYPDFDLCDPPADHDQFDVVVCEQVLEHVIDPWLAARTLYDLCRDGGHLIVSTPFLIRVHKAPGDYWRFTDDGLRLLLERAGFVVDEVKTWGNRSAVWANLWHWPVQRPWRSLRNVEDCPTVVWAFARRPAAR